MQGIMRGISHFTKKLLNNSAQRGILLPPPVASKQAAITLVNASKRSPSPRQQNTIIPTGQKTLSSAELRALSNNFGSSSYRRLSTVAQEILPAANFQKKNKPQGLTGPHDGKDSCGTFFIINTTDAVSDEMIQQDPHLVNHEVIKEGLEVSKDMSNRGAEGIDGPDGVGVTLLNAVPSMLTLFEHVPAFKENEIPAIIFSLLPSDPIEQARAKALLVAELTNVNLSIRAERRVPVVSRHLSYPRREHEPQFFQYVVTANAILADPAKAKKALDMALTRADMRFELQVRDRQVNPTDAAPAFACPPHNFSASRTNVTYKGLLGEVTLPLYFPDLTDTRVKAMGIIGHSRFATNVAPAWHNVQPLKGKVAINGEDGNDRSFRRALTDLLKKFLDLHRITLDGLSDSAVIALWLQYLQLAGYSLAESLNSCIYPSFPERQTASTRYYKALGGIPIQGPTHCIGFDDDNLTIAMDPAELRPQVGIISKKIIGTKTYTKIISSSELPNRFDLTGKRFRLCGGDIWRLNLITGEYGLYKGDPQLLEFHQQQLEKIMPLPATRVAKLVTPFTDTDNSTAAQAYELRKLQAGYTPEVERKVMYSLFNDGKDSKTSMGNNKPPEAMVPGPDIDLYGTLYAHFAMITMPPFNAVQDGCLMSLDMVIGAGLLPHELNTTPITKGIHLKSPILDNEEMAAVENELPTIHIDALWHIDSGVQGLRDTLEKMAQQAIAAVLAGKTVLILSDKHSDKHHTGIFAPLACFYVHKALAAAGLREKVSLIAQFAEVLGPLNVLPVLSLGNVEAIHPWLVCVPEPAELPPTTEENLQHAEKRINHYKARINSYKTQMNKEISTMMARNGIVSVQRAYNRQGAFHNIGFDEELTEFFDITNKFMGTISMARVVAVMRKRHEAPEAEGLGRTKDRKTKNPARPVIWSDKIVRQRIKASRDAGPEGDKAFAEMCAEIHELKKTTNLRGRLDFAPPPFYSEGHPIKIAIIGAGAAGMYATAELLKSGLPITIDIYEEDVCNKLWGLVGEGVSPLHAGTKDQALTFDKLLTDPRVSFNSSHVIEALGREPVESLPADIPCAGWSTRKGGTLKSARDSAKSLVETMKDHFEQQKKANNTAFLTRQPVPLALQYYKIPATVNSEKPIIVYHAISNQQALNLRHYTKEVTPHIRTYDDYRHACNYHSKQSTAASVPASTASTSTAVPAPVAAVPATASQSVPGSIGFIQGSGDIVYVKTPPSSDKRTGLSFFKTSLPSSEQPKHACGGEIVCGECALEVVEHPNKAALQQSCKDAEQVSAILENKPDGATNQVLSCAHPATALDAGVYRIPRK